MPNAKILVTVTPEPPAYHDIKHEQTRLYAVHLAFGGDRDAVAKLLNNGEWRFNAYQLNGMLVADITSTVIASQTPIKDSKERLTDWLGKVSTFGSSTEVGGTVELDGTTSSTVQRANVLATLHGSITWDAPLPQDLGLTYLVKCDLGAGVSWPTEFLILPITPATISTQRCGDGTETVVVAGPDSVTVVTRPVQNAEDPPEPLCDDGFIKSTFLPDDHRLIERLESQGASLIGMLAPFTGFLSAELRRLNENSATIDAEDLTKYTRIGCCLALDPLLLAIGAPPSDRAGVLLGGLAVEINSRLLAGTLDATNRQTLVTACINGVRSQAKSMAEAATADEVSLTSVGVPPEIVDSFLPSPGSLSALIDGLNALMAHFQQESGLERALCAIIEGFRTSPTLEADQSEKDAISNACQAYLDALDRGINAADAVRAEIGHRVLTEVLQHGKSADEALKASKAYLSRLEAEPLAPCIPVTADVSTELKSYLEARWKVAVGEIAPATNAPAHKRFQPDSVPQPLPISISTTANAKTLDEFTKRFNGIGVVIRSADPVASVWTHANLAECHPWLASPPNQGSPYDSESCRVGIRPLLPVAVDGRREMFLRYRGFPLSSEAYRDTIRDAGSVSTTPSWRQAFYESHDFDNDAGKYARVPRLAYGNTYEWVAYAVTKGGSLPFILQNKTAGAASLTPWLPKADLKDFNPPHAEVVGDEKYRRRTTVGATTIVDAPGQPPRIGIRYPEVYPLALDSPRVCISSINTKVLRTQPFVDLFRNADGSGQLETTTDDTWHLRLDGLLLHSNAAVFVIAELRGYDAQGEFVVSTRKSVSSDDSSVEIALASPPAPAAPPAGGGPGAADRPVSRNLWLRLRLEANNEGASLACNSPSMTRSSAGPASQAGKSHAFQCDPDTPPVLLVGASPCWSPAFQKVARLHVVLPRTTWLDWEHWCGNRSLPIYGNPREQDASKNDAYSIADRHLLTASVLRSLDDEINRLLDRLPDPSVSAVIAELTLIDVHGEVRYSAAPPTDPRPLVSAVIPYSDLIGDAFNAFKSLAGKSGLEYGESLRETLKKLDETFSVPIDVKPRVAFEGKGPDLPSLDWDNKTLAISIPEGTIARLTIRPFVAWPQAGHPAFHPGIRQLLVGEATVAFGGGAETPGCLFEGASLTIEAMYDLPSETNRKNAPDEHEALLKAHIEITPIPRVRDYRVMFVPERLESGKAAVAKASDPTAATAKVAPGDFPDRWRLFSHVEMRTQRWRFSGRPIYGWIAPKQLAKRFDTTDRAVPAACPAVEQQTSDVIKRFEAELFFDRDDADCEFTRVRLTGGRDELLACPWELPSATYFRHAFNFVSRYAGAMRPGSGVPLLPRRQADWSHRVAMLADAPRLEFTRPQMRCIVPLTTSPDDVGPSSASPDIEQRRLAPTPPVACILEERPFAVGGLAERMLGEIVTGVGYGFDGKQPAGDGADGKASRVQPMDFAKETSRDGRLSAWAWTPPFGDGDQPSPARSFVVETEGPVGLHFEEVTTSASAWSNCQYLLRPRSLRDHQALPEESFLGVQLRRFLDPEWIFDPDRSSPQENGAKAADAGVRWPMPRACIARHKLTTLADSSGPLARVAIGQAGQRLSLIDFEVRRNAATKHASVVVFVCRQLLGAGYREGSLALCELPLLPNDEKGDLAILHLPHGDGSFTVSIAYVPDDEDAETGCGNAPLIVGTARWTLAHLSEVKPVGDASAPNADPGDIMLEFPPVAGIGAIVRATAMSQPTYREWTRTAKNADFVNLMTGTGEALPVRVAQVRAKVIPSPAPPRFAFCVPRGWDRGGSFSDGESTALWLCDSLADSRMPLFVHRYLVGVFTTAPQPGSHACHSFAHAGLLGERKPRFPAHVADRIDALTIHEMEVPAVIVAGGGNLPPSLDRFKAATIDLRATGGMPESDRTLAYRLRVRFANSAASMKTVSSTVAVTTPNRTMTLKVPKGVHSFDVMWTSVPPPPPRAEDSRVRFILWDCLEKPPTNPTNEPNRKDAPSDCIQVRIDPDSRDTEIWADVSLLHREVDAGWTVTDDSFDAFSFDWLFSSRDASEDRAEAVRILPHILAARSEAQGRFVSSSDPIWMDRTKD